MYEFQYRPSFSSELKPKTVIGDHGDELFSVFGAPFLKGDGLFVTMNLELGAPGPGFDLVTLGKFLLLCSCSSPEVTITGWKDKGPNHVLLLF